MSLQQEIASDDQIRQEQVSEIELDQSRVGRLSRMDALQNQAMGEATHQRRELELKKIASALHRLDEGEFGECLSCGEEVNHQRLAIDPAATQCIVCAEKAEGH